ncbi:MAG: hypothetical protein E7588_03310 [Ruminococcaceae bacterium]|nr:hypothetical protein [Oscillospiraceae bacterium]
MELSFEKIKEITTGAVRVELRDGLIHFYRFTKDQEQFYKTTNPDFYMKSLSSAGIKFLFETNSESLLVKGITAQGSSRKYFSIDVFADKKTVGCIDNFSHMEIPDNYAGINAGLGGFEKEFKLGGGTKTVCIHLPWSVSTAIEKLTVDDNAFIKALKPPKKLIAYGDSITHGYDALRPSNRYIAMLAEAMNAEEFNKAIGAERFSPELAQLKDSFEPDYITVAYGTNDWSVYDEQTFKSKCKGFYTNLRKSHPTAKIFAISPIWRSDMHEKRDLGPFESVSRYIKELAESMDNTVFVDGIDFVPHDSKYYADLRLHPNDSGFEHYFNNLYDKIKSQL